MTITCNDGRVTHFTFRVSHLPGASGAGEGGSVYGMNTGLLTAGAVLAVRRRRAGSRL